MAEEFSPAREPEVVEVPARKPRRRKTPVEPSGTDAEAIVAAPRRRPSRKPAETVPRAEPPMPAPDSAMSEPAASGPQNEQAELAPALPFTMEAAAEEDWPIVEAAAPADQPAYEAAPPAVEEPADPPPPVEPAAEDAAPDLLCFVEEPAEPDPSREPPAEDAAPDLLCFVEEPAESDPSSEPPAEDPAPGLVYFADEPAESDPSREPPAEDAALEPGEAFLPDSAEPAPDEAAEELPVVFADQASEQDLPSALEEPAGTDSAGPDRAELENMAMPKPVMPDVKFGDGRREPTFSPAFREAPAEPPVLELEPLTPPPDNSPSLVPRGAAAPPAEEPAQEPESAAAPASKAWGPVHGAIDAALANLGPLLPISRAGQLRRQVADALGAQLVKIASLADSLVFAKLPWLRRIGVLVPRRRSTLIGGGLLVAAASGGLGVRLLQPGAPVTVPARVDSAVPLPSHVARRLGQELEMPVVPLPKGTLALFATGADQLDSALALSRREAAGDGIVISLDALAAASRRVLAWYGLDTAVTVKPTPGPTLTFQGDIPDALYPLARAALANIGQLLGRDPILRTVQLRDQIGRSDTALLRAIFIGTPKSIVYTADGAREIGQPLYGGFAITAIEPDGVVLAPAQPGSQITVTIPLREPSAATVKGPPLAALPDRSAIVLAQQPRPAKE